MIPAIAIASLPEGMPVIQLLVNLASRILALLYGLIRRVCKSRTQIVCISRQTDGTTVDFELIRDYIAEHNPSYRVVVLAKTLSSPLRYLFHIPRQVYYLATSQAVVLDSYCIAVSLLGEAIQEPVIQLWHAMGNMKKFGYAALDTSEGRSSKIARIMHMHEGYNCVVISSRAFIDDYVAGFNINPDIVFECPLPKTDLILDPVRRSNMREKILAKHPELGEKQNIVYCPTFRKPVSAYDADALERLADAIDYDRFNLIYKKHPVSTLRFSDNRVLQDEDPELDMLYIADYVVSDYSTVIYEAGLLAIPVYLYLYDGSSYPMRRGLNIDVEHDVPAPKAADPLELMRLIQNDAFDAGAYATFIANNITVPSNESCTERLVKHIMSMIDNSSC